LKVLQKIEDRCIACSACEMACSNAYFKVRDRAKSAIHITEQGQEKRIHVCNQCGYCMDICPVLAIKRDALGVVRIDKKKCVGCYMCVGFCEAAVMMQHDDQPEPFKCVACGICAGVCPAEALYIDKEAVVEKLEKFTF
jgi:Fe-S-cluster-containing hydrogenase component 2